MLKPINPYSGVALPEYNCLTSAEIETKISELEQGYKIWRACRFDDRAAYLKRVATEMRVRKNELAEQMAIEMGKPIKEGRPEVEKAAACAEYYAENAPNFLSDEKIASDAKNSYVTYQPLGPLLGILPWNAPAWLAFRYLAPALMAGNTCLFKHDPHVPKSAELIMNAFEAAMPPCPVVAYLPLANEQVADIITDKRIQAVSFTGSSLAGGRVAALAASTLKPAVLELGGSDPCIVLEDANLEKAANIVTLSRTINAGQSCIAAKRILIQKSVYDQFTTMLHERLEKLKMGDPLAEDTDIGPIARRDLRDNLHRQVQETIKQGARLLLGGNLPDGPGFHYPPTLLADVGPSMCAFEEETFGPVMCVCAIDDFEEGVELANNTEYGLAASIWTKSEKNAQRAANELIAGQVAINGIVKTDPRLPSGGVKQSGYGRELGPHGIREFVNTKQIWIGEFS